MQREVRGTGLSRRWPLLFLALAVVIVLAAAVLVYRPAPPPASPLPVGIESSPWQVGAGVDLALRSPSPGAGQVISVTVLAPGPGRPQLEGLEPGSFGLSGVQIPWLLAEYRDTEMALAAAAGARYISLDFDWRRIEPQRGVYIWQDTDEVVALAKEHGLQLAPMLLYTPQWASTAPFAPLDYQHAPPSDYAAYRDFVYAVVNRYKSFGASPLTSDGYGISDWVIWNEPNIKANGEAPEPGSFWTGSLEEYLSLLRVGYEGAHAADPACNVLNGALADLPWAGGALYLAHALERFYDPDGDGDASDGARPFFDTLNIHTYQLGAPDAAWYEDRLAAILGTMERFGDGEKLVWITETGYGSLPAPAGESPFVDEGTQVDGVRLVYQATAAYPQVERVFWWSLRDYHHNTATTNPAMEGHYGLLRATFEPKPAYLAYGQLTGRLGDALTLASVTDKAGQAQVTVPASFLSQPGEYIVFVTLEGTAPAGVVTYEAPAAEGGQP